MSANNHKPGKRKNILRWMENRQRRLWYKANRGKATDRQVERCNRLTAEIAKAGGAA